MSYAQAAAKGPKQSPEEARAPAPPQVEHDEGSVSSMVDVDSPHVSSVPSDYHGETTTQATRREHEAEDAQREAEQEFEEAEQKASEEYKKGKAEASKKAKEAKGKAKELSNEASEKAQQAKSKAKELGADAGDMAKDFKDDVSENRDNPVVVGNALVLGLGTALLGFGAYKKYSAGELSWKVAGAWGGIIGLFCAGDYYLSQWLFKNKYPRK